jgi:hypothetical protein
MSSQHLVDEVKPAATRPAPKAIAIPAMVGLLIGTVFVSIFLAAFHAPRTHDLPLGIVGTAAQTAAVEQGLTDHAPGSVAFTRYATEDAARKAIEDREVYGAYSAGAGGRTAKLLYAGANGPAVTATLQGMFGAAQAVDVLPTSPGDTRGLSIFYAGFGLVLAGFLFGLVSYQMAPRLQLRMRLLSLVSFAVAAGAAVTLIAGHTGFNALPGNLAAIASVTVLLALAVGATTLLLMRLAGPAGTLLSSLILLILGNATGGGTLPPAYLPDWLHPLAHVLPVGLGIRALQGVAYFHHDGYLIGVLLLMAWVVVGLGGVTLADTIAERRQGRIEST